MEIKRAGSQPSQKGPADFFTGNVRIDPLNAPPAASKSRPSASAAWASASATAQLPQGGGRRA
jgi:hypothetical protein